MSPVLVLSTTSEGASKAATVLASFSAGQSHRLPAAATELDRPPPPPSPLRGIDLSIVVQHYTAASRAALTVRGSPRFFSWADTHGSNAPPRKDLLCIYLVPADLVEHPDILTEWLEPVLPVIQNCTLLHEPATSRALAVLLLESAAAAAEVLGLYAGQHFPASVCNKPNKGDAATDGCCCHIFPLSDVIVSADEELAPYGRYLGNEYPWCGACLGLLDEPEHEDHTPLFGQVPANAVSVKDCVACAVSKARRTSARVPSASGFADGSTTGAAAAVMEVTQCLHPSGGMGVACGETDGLWTCLTCGTIGCSRRQYGPPHTLSLCIYAAQRTMRGPYTF